MRARRWWGWPLVPMYAAGLAVKDGLRRVGVLRTRSLAWPVVSVGSLSAGGAGKTPVVIALAELLRVRGWHVDVLSRGYGREGNDGRGGGAGRVKADDRGKACAAQVEPDARDAAARFGDEPTLIARKTGVPVWVSADRYLAGKSAEEFAAGATWDIVSEKGVEIRAGDPVRGVHLLDDGFQHRGLERTVDVVLVTAQDFEDALLPAGNRREGLRALRRADVVVVREEERTGIEARVRRWVRNDTVVWSVRRRLRFGGGVEVGEHTPGAEASGYTEAGARGRALGFCGIARPEGFWGMLEAAGCEVVGRVAFGDHHRYGMVDVERLVTRARGCGAKGFITTEKDAVKLTAAMRERLEVVGPVVIAGLDVMFVDEAGVVRDVELKIGEERGG